MAKIIGIDLGTTNSAVAVIEGGAPKIIENIEGNRTTPSVVATAKNSDRIVGLLARRQAITNSENTIAEIKRFMGHRFDDLEVQKDRATAPFKIEKGEDGGVKVKMMDKFYRPEEISAMILQKIKTDVEAKLGEKITEAVITVPAYFNDAQRKATKDAGAIAGLDVKRIINEPTAAALAYGFDKKKNEKIVVYDFGGGTFDVSVLEIGGDVIEVKSIDGDSHMGGGDIDRKIVRWIADEYKKESGLDVTKDPLAHQRLREAAEKTKHELSTTMEAEINIPFITSDAGGPKHLLMKMSRATLESLTKDLIDRSIEITKRALEASPFKMNEINEVIMVGGQTRMPAIVQAVKNLFGKEPNMSINPDEVVALGAAVQAGVLAGDVRDVLLLDVIPLSLGIETLGGVATKLIERNTTIPSSKSQVFSTAADNQTSVEIHIVQGERPMASDNRSLGRFILDGVPPAPRGMPQIEVSFDVDANGILNVAAKDKASGKSQSIKIEASSGLKDEDIKKMQKDAELHAEEDKNKKEVVDVKNTAEMIIYTAEKALKDNEAKIPSELKDSVNAKIAALRGVKDGKDGEAIKTATEALSAEMSKIGEAMAKAGATPSPGGTPEQQNAKVKDAEFKESKKDEGEAPKK
ncbi:molecular chaperone DnaK [Candidatus Nomurabacteria bacterium RIFCSPHIGHO2_01_FULL_39_220]|uniref:Chaperone protein DnaK n=1 Tax=Candidatus Nomurabacteria bacterium RIFCSPLOWO2_02_FULL_40_67 TaxID=1801787 RepID=A0A1F6Y2Q0_9BACT|nr:MAG: Chaperone protein DnaK [Parcubacteria group bacterium GW2011_GWA2_40_37]OGI62865.1 MAG: molecular chaperone DnaK [Candidatus Nomurabacteria bacterium RBG_16_40_11]OGI69393.1 MAG: molecular chaperone DnaK [Candidatus Nomurabacteria bacterium RIFCSPHIGHO2_01_FULL_39_220]OGI72733.1 MAG: molecular chaperone DnaK [Candidatus Nomurabacteria bacterium RIFCSPHIGHO2_02_41_18]OGI78252.1 MAG: molecular chaperone DnaK [Candidatus Nomurabacteria bacterium RIFCSPHIGHO2_02_FULL_41_150]OGI81160.1 MAG: